MRNFICQHVRKWILWIASLSMLQSVAIAHKRDESQKKVSRQQKTRKVFTGVQRGALVALGGTILLLILSKINAQSKPSRSPDEKWKKKTQPKDSDELEYHSLIEKALTKHKKALRKIATEKQKKERLYTFLLKGTGEYKPAYSYSINYIMRKLSLSKEELIDTAVIVAKDYDDPINVFKFKNTVFMGFNSRWLHYKADKDRGTNEIHNKLSKEDQNKAPIFSLPIDPKGVLTASP